MLRNVRRRAAMALVAADFAAVMVPALLVGVPMAWALAHALVTVALYAEAALYRSRLQWSLLDDLPALIGRQAASAALLTVSALSAGLTFDVSDLGIAGCLAILSSLLLREAVYSTIRGARRKGVISHSLLVIGGGSVAADLVATIKRHPELGLRPIGYVDSLPSAALENAGLPRLGDVTDIGQLVNGFGARVLLLTYGAARDRDVAEVLRVGGALRCDTFVVPRLFEVTRMKGGTDHIGAVTVTRLDRPGWRGPAPMVKRGFDIVASALALAVLSPVLAGCAIAVRTTGRSVLFRQVRIGKDGQEFQLYKFRSMRPASEVQTGTTWSAVGDPRMTAVGRIMRRTSLDELPQLWNVLRGDMTLVGPRPERPFFVDQFTRKFPHYAYRHRVRAGLTGMAQVSGLRGGDSSIDLRARYDNYYIENWSLWLDIKVIVRTVREVVRGGGG